MDETYTGHVEPRGAPARRDLDGITVTKLSVGPMDNNAYLLTCRSTGEALLIDAANDADRLLRLLEVHADGAAPRPVLRLIVTTHRHADHWQALVAVAEATGAAVAAGDADAAELPVPVGRRLAHGDTVTVGAADYAVIGLRGHTPGSIALLYREPSGSGHVFTGDSLFPGGIGRVTRREDFESLMRDVETRIFDALPDDTWVYPGHGDDTTLGAERPHLREWRDRGW